VAEQRRGEFHEEVASLGDDQNRAENDETDDQFGDHLHRDADDALHPQNMCAHRLHGREPGAPEKAGHEIGKERVAAEDQRGDKQDRPARAAHPLEHKKQQDRGHEIRHRRGVIFPALLDDLQPVKPEIARAGQRKGGQAEIHPRQPVAQRGGDRQRQECDRKKNADEVIEKRVAKRLKAEKRHQELLVHRHRDAEGTETHHQHLKDAMPGGSRRLGLWRCADGPIPGAIILGIHAITCISASLSASGAAAPVALRAALLSRATR
jgi:hypothetical protein